MSAKSLVVRVHPLNENELHIEEHPDGTVTIPLMFRDRAAGEDFIQAINDQNTSGAVRWNRTYEQVQAAGGLSDDLRGE